MRRPSRPVRGRDGERRARPGGDLREQRVARGAGAAQGAYALPVRLRAGSAGRLHRARRARPLGLARSFAGRRGAHVRVPRDPHQGPETKPAVSSETASTKIFIGINSTKARRDDSTMPRLASCAFLRLCAACLLPPSSRRPCAVGRAQHRAADLRARDARLHRRRHQRGPLVHRRAGVRPARAEDLRRSGDDRMHAQGGPAPDCVAAGRRSAFRYGS